MKFIFTFFDVLASLLIKTIESLPRPIKLILYIPILIPIMCLAAWADYKGWTSSDVL